MILKNKPIFFEIIFHFLFLLILLIFIVSIIFFQITKNHYLNNLTNHLKDNIILIQDIIKDDFINNNIELINEKIKKIGAGLNIRITVVKNDGEVIADSQEDYRNMENHINRAEILSALSDNTGKEERYSNTLKIKMLYIALPINYNNSISGVIRVSIALKEIEVIIDSFRNKLLLIVLSLLFLITIYVFYYSKRFTDPIKALSINSKKVADGDFKAKLFLKDNYSKEINELSINYNVMVENLSKLFGELEKGRKELEGIISSLTEGILVIDYKGRIFRANGSFLKLINVNNVINKFYWEVLREKEIIEKINYSIEENKNLIEELYYEDKSYILNINHIKGNKGIIIILCDITDLKELENIKKDLISNVSHELRTPLSVIKGYIETILENKNRKENDKYLSIIKNNVERLINIVNDLLILSKLESIDKKNLNFKIIDLRVIIKNICKIFEEKIISKKLKLNIEFDENKKFKLECDPFRIEQMLINLIDNAVKYTDAGSITMKIREDMENIKIDVIDTGIGIPKKDLSRIFERFFTVDKSRSKKSGGTGLGLSIVKHIVLLYNGEIKVKSILGSGSTFSIILPKKRFIS